MSIWEVSEALGNDGAAHPPGATNGTPLVGLGNDGDDVADLEALAQLEAMAAGVALTSTTNDEISLAELDALSRLEQQALATAVTGRTDAAETEQNTSMDALLAMLEGDPVVAEELSARAICRNEIIPVFGGSEIDAFAGSIGGGCSGVLIDERAFDHEQHAAAAAPPRDGAPRGPRNVPERKDWSAEEDDTIRKGVRRFGCRWRRIAELLPGRSDDAVRNRWSRIRDLDEGLDAPRRRSNPSYASSRAAEDGGPRKPERVSWTRQEDTVIVAAVAELGHKWSQLVRRLPGRTEHAIRNRFHRLQAMARDGVLPAPPAPLDFPEPFVEPSAELLANGAPLAPLKSTAFDLWTSPRAVSDFTRMLF